ncbi:MAG: hypothetical protein ACI33N_01200, partial [Desulfovibrionaceae bacterium]
YNGAFCQIPCQWKLERYCVIIWLTPSKFEDFPKEPIGIDGTLAHALERVPTIVCERSGYEVRSLERVWKLQLL